MLLGVERAENELVVTEETLIHSKNLYAKKLLTMLIVLVTLNYQADEKTARFGARGQARGSARSTVSNIPP